MALQGAPVRKYAAGQVCVGFNTLKNLAVATMHDAMDGFRENLPET